MQILFVCFVKHFDSYHIICVHMNYEGKKWHIHINNIIILAQVTDEHVFFPLSGI